MTFDGNDGQNEWATTTEGETCYFHSYFDKHHRHWANKHIFLSHLNDFSLQSPLPRPRPPSRLHQLARQLVSDQRLSYLQSLYSVIFEHTVFPGEVKCRDMRCECPEGYDITAKRKTNNFIGRSAMLSPPDNWY